MPNRIILPADVKYRADVPGVPGSSSIDLSPATDLTTTTELANALLTQVNKLTLSYNKLLEETRRSGYGQ